MKKKSQVSLYKSTPDHYDAMMSTKLETTIFQAVASEIKKNLKSGKNLILDLCCGTGILAKILLNIPNLEFIGVDKNKEFLESARQKTKNNKNFKFILQDVLKYKTDLKFDIVILTFAYHHIENKFKTKLLQKIFKLLKDGGALIIYEKAILPYSNKKEFAQSNEEFYLKRIEYLKKTEKKKLSDKQFNALMNVCALSSSAEEEYKVDYDYIVKDLNKVGFKIIKEIKIWPKKDIFNNKKVGDFIFVVKKK